MHPRTCFMSPYPTVDEWFFFFRGQIIVVYFFLPDLGLTR